MEKIIFIDIDGVINALTPYLSPEHKVASGFNEWKHFEVLREHHPDMFLHQKSEVVKYDINYSPELLHGLGLIQEEGVEIRFLTTWGQNAHSVFCDKADFTTGKDWDTYEEFTADGIFGKDDSVIGSWWKHHVLKRELLRNPTKQIVFVDDIALMHFATLYESTNHAAATKSLILQHPNFMVVVPNPNIGISQYELETLLHKDFFENSVFVSDGEIGESDMGGL